MNKLFNIQRFANISNSNSNTLISGTSDNDYIYNTGSEVSINAGAGNDSINNNGGDYVIITAGADADSIYLYNNYATVDSGADDDTIRGSSYYSSINGGAGNDLISLDGGGTSWGTTIKGGTGNDIIYSESSSNYQYANGDGNDTIYGITSNDTLHITSGSVSSSSLSGSDIILAIGTGRITLKDAAGKSFYLKNGSNSATVFSLGGGGGDDDSITNYTKNTTVRGTASADYIINYAGGVKIYAGEGNDYIYNSTSSNYTINNSWGYVTIDAGAGNDTIYSHDPYVSISGGAGNDYIYNNNYSYVTINGGTGNDTVSLNSSSYKIYQYSSGDGYDIIYGWTSTDTLNISGSYTTAKSGSDLIVSVGSGKITVVGGANVNFKIETVTGGNSISLPLGWKKDSAKNLLQATVASAENEIDLTEAYGADVETVDASKISNVEIYGNDLDNSLKGGAGNDILYGGSGNDTLTSGAGDDIFIYSGGDDVILDYAAGQDSIQINTADIEITGVSTVDSGIIYETSEGNLTVKNGKGKNITLIDANGDEIIIDGGGSNSKLITGTSGADSIYNTLTGATIDTGAGNDSIDNIGNNVLISAGAGTDTITNYSSNNSLATGKNITISAGAGDDSIANHGEKALIYGEAGSDIINNSSMGITTTIFGGADNDSIKNSSSAFISGGEGADSITNTNFGGKSTVNGDTGNDYIITSGASTVSVSGGAGNDTIYSTGKAQGVTINGGAGHDILVGDSVNTYGVIYQYSAGDGYDTIRNYNSNDTISIGGSADYQTVTSGSNVLVSLAAGSITLVNASDKTLNIKGGKYIPVNTALNITNTINNTIISGTSGNDSILNKGKNVTINAGAGNDSIENDREYVLINGSDGNDTIDNQRSNADENLWGRFSTIYGGDGNDSINNSCWNVTIYGGSGDDTISNGNHYVLIEGGAGNDSIFHILSQGITINGGEGNDTILNAGGDVDINAGVGEDVVSLSVLRDFDTNEITSYGSGFIKYSNGDGNDTIYGISDYNTLHITSNSVSSSVSGSDVILKVGSGTITLKDAVDQSFYLKIGNNSAVSTIFSSITLPDGWKYANTAKTSITATLASADDLDLTEDYGAGVIKVDGSKTTGGVVIYGNSLSNSIKGGKGADEIFGGAGNDTVSLGSGNDTYIYSSGNDVIQNYAAGQDKIKFETAIQNASVSGSNLIITTSEGKVTVNKGKDKNVSVIDSNGDTFTIYNEYPTVNPYPAGISVNGAILTASTAFTGNEIDIADYDGVTKVNAAALTRGVSIIGDSSANSIKGGKGADKIYGGAGNDTVSLGGGNDTYIYSGGNDLIQDYATVDAIKFETEIESASVSGSNLIITTSEGKVTVKNGKNKNVSVIDSSGDTFTIYNEYPTVNPYPAGISISGVTLTASTVFKGKEINIADYDGVTKVNAAALSSGVSIIGDSSANVLTGGKGADVIYGDEGNDTVSLGGGNDTYIYSGGNDLIQDYAAGADKIKFETEIESATVSGSNLIITTSEGKVTVKNGKNKNVSVIDSSDGTFTIYNEYPTVKPDTDTVITLTDKADSETYSEDNIKVAARGGHDKITVEGNYISINAGDGNDKIIIEYGAEEVTIFGGKGNDQITNNEASNTVYEYATGDGNDIIIGYNENDSVVITKGSYTYDVSGNDFIITVGNGKITLKDSAKKTVTIVDEHGNSEEIPPITPPPEGWSYDRTKTKLTATRNADNYLDLTQSYGESIEVVDASKINSDVEIYAHDNGVSIKSGGKADSITGGAGNDIVSLGAGEDTYVYNGGDDIFQDYAEGKDVIRIDIDGISADNGSQQIQRSANGADIIYTFKNKKGTLTVKNVADKKITVIDRNDEEIIFDEFPHDWKFVESKNLLQATISSAENEIDLSESYGAEIEKVDGSKISGGVTITGNDLSNSIKGGAGNDVLSGGTDGNDILTSGAGDDTLIYISGDDVITDYTPGKDVICIAIDNIFENKNIISSSISGKDLIYTFDGAGTLKIVNGATKEISLVDEDGRIINLSSLPDGWKYGTSSKTNTDTSILTATISTAENQIDLTESYGDGVEKVDALKISDAVIIGNDLDNSIKTGAGNDELDGGAEGNDTLTGGKGDDIFIYSGGDDLITDYGTGNDYVRINTVDITINDIKTVSSNVVIYTSVGNLTLRNGKNKTVNLIDDNNNAINFSKSSKNVVEEKIWFLEDDSNFIASDIDSITEEKFAVTNIQPQNYSSLAQGSNILTFTDEK